jgi:hypothetical protein
VKPEDPAIDMQRLGKQVPAATNTHATIELLDYAFAMQSVSYQITQYAVKGRFISYSYNFL